MFKFKVGDVVAIKGSEQMMSVVDVDGVGGEVSVIYSGTVGIVRGSVPVECLEPEEVARARKVDPDEPLSVPPDAHSPSPKVDVQAETPSSEVRPTEATPEVKSLFV